MRDHEIVISPLKDQLRKGWFDDYQSETDEDGWDGYIPLPSEEDGFTG